MGFINSLLEKVVSFLAAFFAGRITKENEVIKDENKILKDNLGMSDSDLADKLRSRAANKRKNK